ncbi:MAG: PAS domain S-box protein [Mariprofundaceae bacterium]|nr:PAS domain S-box protein [Mariprofundaceae bacterium]
MRVWRLNFTAVGLGVALLYWLAESLLHTFFWETAPLSVTLLAQPGPDELFMRLVTVAVIVGFGCFTEHGKRHYQALAIKQLKTNRLLRFLSEVNQYVQRQPDEQSILDAACRAAVEIGEFKFAWVGTQRPEGFTLAASASADPALNEQQILLQDHEALLGCLGCRAVLDEGVAQLCELDAKVDCPAAWKKSFLSRGCRHAYAMPVRVSGRVAGVFEVYAGEGVTLSGEERSLLDEVADDVSVVLTNIEQETLRQQAQAALDRSQALNASIVASAMDGIISMNSRGEITEFNPAAVAMFGYRRSEVVGKPLAEKIIPPDMRDRHQAGLQHYLETGEGPVLGTCIEVNAMHADGHTFPVELCVSRVPGEDPPLFTAILRDISQRKKAEAALRQRLDELERFRKASVDREFRIKELRDEVAELKREAGAQQQSGVDDASRKD